MENIASRYCCSWLVRFFEILSLIIERTTFARNLSSSKHRVYCTHILHTLYIIHHEVNMSFVTGCQNISYEIVSRLDDIHFENKFLSLYSGAHTNASLKHSYSIWVREKFQERPHRITKRTCLNVNNKSLKQVYNKQWYDDARV